MLNSIETTKSYMLNRSEKWFSVLQIVNGSSPGKMKGKIFLPIVQDKPGLFIENKR